MEPSGMELNVGHQGTESIEGRLDVYYTDNVLNTYLDSGDNTYFAHYLYNTTNVIQGEMRDYEEWRYGNVPYRGAIMVLNELNKYYTPIMAVGGLFGNGLSFLVFFFTHLKRRSSSYYLGSLAMSDFGYLITLLCVWLTQHGVNVMNRGGWCQLIVYLSSCFSSWSVWLTVGFTAERFVAVNYPLWRMQLGTSQRAQAVVGTTALCSFSLNAYLLYFVGTEDKPGNGLYCELLEGYDKLMQYINIVDTILTLVIPVLLIIYMNTMIARALYLFYSHHSFLSVQGDCINQRLATSSSNGQERFLPQATQVNIARMLLLVSTFFIILNLPSYVVRLHGFVLQLTGTPSINHIIVLRVLQGYFMLLYYTNFAINFVVYNVSSRIFRRALGDAITKLCHPNQAPYSNKRGNSDNSNFIA